MPGECEPRPVAGAEYSGAVDRDPNVRFFSGDCREGEANIARSTDALTRMPAADRTIVIMAWEEED